MHIDSKLPNVGTTIFSVMSALAVEHRAINLGQGFPDFDCDPALVDAVTAAMQAGHNQYPPMPGIAPLRDAIAAKIETLYGRRYDPASEITVTAGATQAIFTAIMALVRPGDEVVVLEPAYDSYAPSIELAGGRVVRVRLGRGDGEADFRPDFDRIAAALTPRTRALLVNTPHNPTGTCWRQEELDRLAQLLDGTDTLLISDEVYEHMVFDGQAHCSASSHPSLAARSLVISSFGKTYHVTGWKVGYVCAPKPLMGEFRKVHQFNVFTVNTPMQHGLAQHLKSAAPYLELPAFYQRKRDLFRDGLAGSRFRLLPCEGSYFQCVDYSAISDLPEEAFCRWLIEQAGVAAIPLSAFYEPAVEQHIVRFCFAKRDETLQAALQRLAPL
jgi:methionine aminotransferase